MIQYCAWYMIYADKPRPQEQYFQESPFLIGQGIPGKTGPQERGEENHEVSEHFLFWCDLSILDHQSSSHQHQWIPFVLSILPIYRLYYKLSHPNLNHGRHMKVIWMITCGKLYLSDTFNVELGNNMLIWMNEKSIHPLCKPTSFVVGGWRQSCWYWARGRTDPGRVSSSSQGCRIEPDNHSWAI